MGALAARPRVDESPVDDDGTRALVRSGDVLVGSLSAT
jgi:hypothetical protein